MTRTRIHKLDVEDVRDYVLRTGVVTTQQVAEAFGCHWVTAQHKLRACVHRGWLIEDDYDAEGHRLRHDNHRWCENG